MAISNEKIKEILKNKLKYRTQTSLANELGYSQPKMSRLMNNGVDQRAIDTINDVLKLEGVTILDITEEG
jgi:predicted XRE-type DNA-binding protein